MTSFLFVNRDENDKPVNELTSQLGTGKDQYKMWIDIGSKELKVGILGKDGSAHLIAFKHLFQVFGTLAKDAEGKLIKNSAGRARENRNRVLEIAQLEAAYNALCQATAPDLAAIDFYEAMDTCLNTLKNMPAVFSDSIYTHLTAYFRAEALKKFGKPESELAMDEKSQLDEKTAKSVGEYLSELHHFLGNYEAKLTKTAQTIAQGGSKFLNAKQHECALATHYQVEDTNLAPWRRFTQAIATQDFKQYIQEQFSTNPDATPIIRIGVGSPAAAMDSSRKTNPIKNVSTLTLPADVFDIAQKLDPNEIRSSVSLCLNTLVNEIIAAYSTTLPKAKNSKRKKSKSAEANIDSNSPVEQVIKLLGLEEKNTVVTSESVMTAIEKTKANQMKKFDFLFMQQDFAQVAKERFEVEDAFEPVVILLGPGRLNKTANVVFTDENDNMRVFKCELDKTWVETNVAEDYSDVNDLMEEATSITSKYWSEVDASIVNTNIMPAVLDAINQVRAIKASLQQGQHGEPPLGAIGSLTAHSAVASTGAGSDETTADSLNTLSAASSTA